MTKTRKLFLLHSILIFSGIHCYCQASKTTDKQFTSSLLTVLNAAANQFVDLPVKRNRSVNIDGSKTFDVSLKFSASSKVVLVKKDKSSYCLISLQKFNSLAEASEASIKYVQLVSTSLKQKVYVFYNADSAQQTTSAFIGIQRFNYVLAANMMICTEISEDSNYTVMLKIAGGTPPFYNLVPTKIAHQSMLFDFNFKTLSTDLYGGGLAGCKTEMAGFKCETVNDETTYHYRYTKTFQDEPNVKFEFSNLTVNIKANLDRNFVYNNISSSKLYLAEMQFLQLKDINKKERSVICVRILKIGKKQYQLILDLIPVSIAELPFP
jgi:hypothetical protein